MGAHAKLSPSGAARWMACPGQPRQAAPYADEDTSSPFAAEGTAYHEVAAGVLTGEIGSVDALIGEKRVVDGHEITLQKDDLDHMMTYVDYCRSLPGEGGVEAKLVYDEDVWGTADFWTYDKETRTLHVVDLKFGRGVLVDAVGNKQALVYALMASKALHNSGAAFVDITIVQPRIGGDPVRTWQIDVLDLFDFETALIAAIKATKDPGAPLIPGDHCKWCPAEAHCPALKSATLAAARARFSETNAAALSRSMADVAMVRAWADAVEAAAYKMAVTGARIDGFKVVAKRAVRRWRDEDNLRDALVHAGYEPTDFQTSKWITPAQAEKKLKSADKDLLAHVIDASSSGTTLVPASDRRPAVKIPAFDVVKPPEEEKT